MKPYRRVAGGVLLHVRVTPNAGADRIEGVERRDDASVVLRVRVAAVPDRGKANQAVVALVAKALGVAKSSVTVTAGETARLKTLRIVGEPEALVAAIEVIGRLSEGRQRGHAARLIPHGRPLPVRERADDSAHSTLCCPLRVGEGAEWRWGAGPAAPEPPPWRGHWPDGQLCTSHSSVALVAFSPQIDPPDRFARRDGSKPHTGEGEEGPAIATRSRRAPLPNESNCDNLTLEPGAGRGAGSNSRSHHRSVLGS